MPRSRKPGPAISRPAIAPVRVKSFAALAEHIAQADRRAAANLSRSRSLRNR